MRKQSYWTKELLRNRFHEMTMQSFKPLMSPPSRGNEQALESRHATCRTKQFGLNFSLSSNILR